jgi:hypothetical protein
MVIVRNKLNRNLNVPTKSGTLNLVAKGEVTLRDSEVTDYLRNHPQLTLETIPQTPRPKAEVKKEAEIIKTEEDSLNV